MELQKQSINSLESNHQKNFPTMDNHNRINSSSSSSSSSNNNKNASSSQGKDNNGERRKRPAPTNQERISKRLSWALRHGGPDIGLIMTRDGYVPVQQILTLRHAQFRLQVTLQDLQELVASNDKQRYQMTWRPRSNYNAQLLSQVRGLDNNATTNQENDTILCIRATQGHSISFIDSDLLLTPLSRDELASLPVIVHGTYHEPWTRAISKQGLCRMGRNHMHFAPGKKGTVTSGMRQSCNIYIYINAQKCANHPDIVFYRSFNGVLLTSGINGRLPVEYFSHVTDSNGKILLDNRETNNKVPVGMSNQS